MLNNRLCAIFQPKLSDLHRIERRALANIVGHDPHIQATRV
jgi:hypothetical protein